MDTSLQIPEFNRQLNFGSSEDALIGVLRKLQQIDSPESVTSLLRHPSGSWFGWDLPDIGSLAPTE